MKKILLFVLSSLSLAVKAQNFDSAYKNKFNGYWLQSANRTHTTGNIFNIVGCGSFMIGTVSSSRNLNGADNAFIYLGVSSLITGYILNQWVFPNQVAKAGKSMSYVRKSKNNDYTKISSRKKFKDFKNKYIIENGRTSWWRYRDSVYYRY